MIPLQTKDSEEFYVLTLSQNKVRLYACWPDRIKRESLDEKTPLSLEESERFLELHKEFQAHAVPSASKPGYMTHGHGGGREDEKIRIHEFIQQVSQGVARKLSGKKVPLILAAVKYEAAMFRDENTYSQLLLNEIEGNPDYLTLPELHQRALEALNR